MSALKSDSDIATFQPDVRGLLIGCHRNRGDLLLEWENTFPVVLHVHHSPFVHGCGVQSDVEMTKMRLSVVSILAFGVGVMDDQPKPRAAGAERGPLQHLKIAVGIAEGGDRTAADVLVDPDGLACLVV